MDNKCRKVIKDVFDLTDIEMKGIEDFLMVHENEPILKVLNSLIKDADLSIRQKVLISHVIGLLISYQLQASNNEFAENPIHDRTYTGVAG